MATQTISGAIYYKAPVNIGEAGTYSFFLFDATGAGWTHVGDHSFSFDPSAADIAQYEAMQSELDSMYAAKTELIDSAIAAATPAP